MFFISQTYLYGNLQGLSWSSILSLYGSWIYNYLCNRCLSPLMFWVWISLMTMCTTLCDKLCQWLVAGQWFSPCTPVSSTNKTACHGITEILLKVALNTIKQPNKFLGKVYLSWIMNIHQNVFPLFSLTWKFASRFVVIFQLLYEDANVYHVKGFTVKFS